MIIDSGIVNSKIQLMKTNKLQLPSKIIRICSFFLLMLVFVGCTGPEGPMGPRGYDGNDGQDGLDGLDGSLNYSVIYDVDATEWSGNLDGYEAWLDVPEITEDIYYEGAVLVYKLIEIDPISFNMLPYTYVDNALIVYMDFDAYLGGINLMYKEVFDGINDTPAPGNMAFKVLIIEGIPLSTLKKMVDVSDYQAVSKLLKVNTGTVNVQ